MRTDLEWTSGTGTGAVEDATAPESFVRACCATALSTVSVLPTPPCLRSPRRPRCVGEVRGGGDAGLLLLAQLTSAGAPAPDVHPWSVKQSSKGGTCPFPDCPRGGVACGSVTWEKQPTAAAGEPPSRRELPPRESRVAASPPLGVHFGGRRSCRRSLRSLGSPSRRTPVPHRPPVSCRATMNWGNDLNAVVLGASG